MDELEADQEAIEYLTHELHVARSRAVRYENALLDILIGARQQSQSHADVTAKCLAALKKEIAAMYVDIEDE